MIDGERVIRQLFDKALAAVEPCDAVQAHLERSGRELIVDGRHVTVGRRLLIVGAGKAAVTMARGVEAVCGDLIEAGIVITKDGHCSEPLPARIETREAAHPIPDQRGVDATRELLNLVQGAGPADVVLAIISGGGSALLEGPRPPAALDDMARTTDLLLRAGAPIQDLNTVRIPLSLVKGGGLRRTVGPATMVTLILSDVLGNDPRVIASGPTVAGEASAEAAVRILRHYGVYDSVPDAVRAVLESETAATSDDNLFEHDVLAIIGDNETALDAAARAATEMDLDARIVWSGKIGEAADLAREWVEACRSAPEDADVLLGGGEATVTVRGDGIGGRNTEFALAAALELEDRGMGEWVIASLATDGQDGAVDAAGAIATAETPSLSLRQDVGPRAAMKNNDSAKVFEAAGGLVRPGPTGTNVNDLYFAVRRAPLIEALGVRH